MSIATEISRLQTAKADIKTAIEAKGVTVPSSAKLDTYDDYIAQIQTGTSPEVKTFKDITFVDYDGEIVQSYTFAEFLTAGALPTNPSHTGLTAQGWNWTLSELTTAANAREKVIVGQLYTTSDGKTRIHIHVGNEYVNATFLVCLRWNQSVSNGITIDWGDDSGTFTKDGTGDFSCGHGYGPGDYVITYTVTSGTLKLGGGSTGLISYTDRILDQEAITAVEFGNNLSTVYSPALRYASITKINIPSTLTGIGDNMFASCYDLKCVVIPRVTSLGTYFASTCTFLETVSLPPTLTTVPNYAFEYCRNLDHVEIGHVVTINTCAFQECHKLNNLSSTVLTTINQQGIYACVSLDTANFPNLVNLYNQGLGVTRLTAPTASSNLSTLMERGMGNMRSVIEWTVKDGITSIPSGYFTNCRRLKIATLPSSVTTINTNVFENCLNMEAIVLKSASPPTLSNVNAINSSNQCPIYIPANSLSSYKSASNWSTVPERFRPWDYGESDYNLTDNTRLNQGTLVTDERRAITDYVPITGGHDIKFHAGSTDSSTAHFCFYDSSYNYLGYYNANAAPRTITGINSNAAYVRMTIIKDVVWRTYIYDVTTGELLWPTKKTS